MLKLKPDTKYQTGVIAGCNRLFAEAYDVKMPTGQEKKINCARKFIKVLFSLREIKRLPLAGILGSSKSLAK